MQSPNILLIQTDQHNPHIAGLAGDPVADTSALNRIAAGGTSFENAYCQSPLCVPSRTSMLAGKYAARCSAWNNGSVIFPEHETLTAHLARNGYTTAAVGKMHFRDGRIIEGDAQLYQ